MPLLGPDDALPHRPRRVVVAGTSGSGKTTVCRRIEAVLGLPRVELDALHHGPGWVPRPEFAADVERFAAGDAWVCEWQYGATRELLAARADLLVWLDLSRATVMRQVVLRTLRRRWRREVLWNGNREPPLYTVLTAPDHIVTWAWTSHAKQGPRVLATAARHPALVVVRLGVRRDVDRWCAGPLRAAAG
jgi:adenylate kinase family enzyme